MRSNIVPLSLLLLVACASVSEELKPIPNPPNLVGKWKGEWGGNMVHPIGLVVWKQEGGRVSGTMTFSGGHGSPTSAHPASGTLGAKPDGSVWLMLDVEGRAFPLRVVSDKRLEGTGQSRGHFGPVTLTRE